MVFGTSASSPVVGSIITLVNDARIAAGKGPVGTCIESNFNVWVLVLGFLGKIEAHD